MPGRATIQPMKDALPRAPTEDDKGKRTKDTAGTEWNVITVGGKLTWQKAKKRKGEEGYEQTANAKRPKVGDVGYEGSAEQRANNKNKEKQGEEGYKHSGGSSGRATIQPVGDSSPRAPTEDDKAKRTKDTDGTEWRVFTAPGGKLRWRKALKLKGEEGYEQTSNAARPKVGKVGYEGSALQRSHAKAMEKRGATSEAQKEEMARLGLEFSPDQLEKQRVVTFGEVHLLLQQVLLQMRKRGAIVDLGVALAHRYNGGELLSESMRNTSLHEQLEPLLRDCSLFFPAGGLTWTELARKRGCSSVFDYLLEILGVTFQHVLCHNTVACEQGEFDGQRYLFDEQSGFANLLKMTPPRSSEELPMMGHMHSALAAGGLAALPKNLCVIYLTVIPRDLLLAAVARGELSLQFSLLPMPPLPPAPEHVAAALKADKEPTMQLDDESEPKEQQVECAASSSIDNSVAFLSSSRRAPRAISMLASSCTLDAPLPSFVPAEARLGNAILLREITLTSTDPAGKSKYYWLQLWWDAQRSASCSLFRYGKLDLNTKAKSERMACFRLTTDRLAAETRFGDKLVAKLHQSDSYYSVASEYCFMEREPVAVTVRAQDRYKAQRVTMLGRHAARPWVSPTGPEAEIDIDFEEVEDDDDDDMESR